MCTPHSVTENPDVLLSSADKTACGGSVHGAVLICSLDGIEGCEPDRSWPSLLLPELL